VPRTFLEQISDPKFISLNDVAAIDAQQFYVTNDNGSLRKTMRHLLGLISPALAGSSVVHYNGKHAHFVVNPGDALMANGIALSLDGQSVYIAESMRLYVSPLTW
jgi:arylesterase / paraoxonase